MNIITLPTPGTLARAAAEKTAAALSQAIQKNYTATWVLAGGSTPMLAYGILARDFSDAVDWSKVSVLMGDERVVPLDSPDSNWGQVGGVLDALGIPAENRLVPQTELGPEGAAEAYEQAIYQMPRFDVVWLGIGEDGHTLSLFPGRAVLEGRLVIAVRDSPKPPPERISLTYEALKKADHCYILVAGQNKAPVIARARKGDAKLPMVRAAITVAEAGGSAVWLLDAAASAPRPNT